MATLRFAHPWLLLALLLVPALAIWRWRRERPATLRYSDVSLLAGLPHTWRVRYRRLPDILRLIVLALLVLAVARPQSSRESQIIHGKGVDIVLALDMSGSMSALDFEPDNRLEAAKKVIDDFITGRQYDRIGLVVFAREAFVQCPPTFDYDMLRQLLAQIHLAPQVGLDDGTAIGMGLAQAENMLEASDAKSQVVILLTDGVNNSGMIAPLTAAQAAKALEIKVYTVGMGRPGEVPFPVQDPLFGTRTQMIESEIDEETLQSIADTTGGAYFRATDTEGLASAYKQIDQMEKSEVSVEVFARYKELATYLLVPALALLLLERLLRETLWRQLP